MGKSGLPGTAQRDRRTDQPLSLPATHRLPPTYLPNVGRRPRRSRRARSREQVDCRSSRRARSRHRRARGCRGPEWRRRTRRGSAARRAEAHDAGARGIARGRCAADRPGTWRSGPRLIRPGRPRRCAAAPALGAERARVRFQIRAARRIALDEGHRLVVRRGGQAEQSDTGVEVARPDPRSRARSRAARTRSSRNRLPWKNDRTLRASRSGSALGVRRPHVVGDDRRAGHDRHRR